MGMKRQDWVKTMACLMGLTMATSSPAIADMRFCNYSSRQMAAALQYPEGTRLDYYWINVGWLGLKPGECSPWLWTGNAKNIAFYFSIFQLDDQGRVNNTLIKDRPQREDCVWLDHNFRTQAGEVCDAKAIRARFYEWRSETVDATFTLNDDH